jgi:hypothetical protein
MVAGAETECDSPVDADYSGGHAGGVGGGTISVRRDPLVAMLDWCFQA